MSDIYSRFYNYIEENSLIAKGDSVLAAVSGGADSMSMLCLLHEYSKREHIALGAVCVDHGFRPEAAAEAEYVGEFCREREIPFFLKEIEPGSCRNSEEEARIHRYRLIEEAAAEGGYSRIALAHNAQDRAETMLFNLFRGSGITGMTGIRPARDRFIRPVLFLDRDEIEEYLDGLGIRYCTDATNLKDDYTRNRIRHYMIPMAREINSGAVRHMAEASDRLLEIETYVAGQTDRAYEEAVSECPEGIYIDVSTFSKQDTVIRSGVLRKIICGMSPHLKDITAEHIRNLDKLAAGDANGVTELPYGIRGIREYDRLLITNGREGHPIEETKITDPEAGMAVRTDEHTLLKFRLLEKKEIDGDAVAAVPRNKYTKWFDYDKINASFCVRSRREADVMCIDAEGHKKSLARIMIDMKIPERIRERIPVVAAGSEVIWLAGYRDSAAYRIDDKTERILEISLWEEQKDG